MQQTYPSLTKALTIEERINTFNVESEYIFDDIQLIYDWLNMMLVYKYGH